MLTLHCEGCGNSSPITPRQLAKSRREFGGPFCGYCAGKIPEDNVINDDEADAVPEGCVDYDDEDRRAYNEELNVRRLPSEY